MFIYLTIKRKQQAGRDSLIITIGVWLNTVNFFQLLKCENMKGQHYVWSIIWGNTILLDVALFITPSSLMHLHSDVSRKSR